MRVTLDHNCIIAVENNEAEAPSIGRLVQMHEQGLIELRLVAVGASERLRDHSYAQSFAVFQERVDQLGLGDLSVLKPICRWDICYWDHSVLADELMVDLESRIHAALFSCIEFEWRTFCAARHICPNSPPPKQMHKWRNAKCDDLSLWCHIHYGGDVFVTADNNYFVKGRPRPSLTQLGAGHVFTPGKSVTWLERLMK